MDESSKVSHSQLEDSLNSRIKQLREDNEASNAMADELKKELAASKKFN